MLLCTKRPYKLERVARNYVVHTISVDDLHSINFRNDVTEFVVILMKIEEIASQDRVVLNSLQCYLPKPDQSHVDVFWKPGVPFRGNDMSPLVIPNGCERCLSKYQVFGFQAPGREKTSPTIGAANLHDSIAEIVCGIDSSMLARYIVLDVGDIVYT